MIKAAPGSSVSIVGVQQLPGEALVNLIGPACIEDPQKVEAVVALFVQKRFDLAIAAPFAVTTALVARAAFFPGCNVASQTIPMAVRQSANDGADAVYSGSHVRILFGHLPLAMTFGNRHPQLFSRRALPPPPRSLLLPSGRYLPVR